MKSVRLRYTGELVKTFSTANVGTLEPGQEFSVPEDMADRFLVRADIELVDGPPKSRRSPKSGDQGGDQGAADGPDTNTGSGDAETGSGEPGPSGDGSGEADPNT